MSSTGPRPGLLVRLLVAVAVTVPALLYDPSLAYLAGGATGIWFLIGVGERVSRAASRSDA